MAAPDSPESAARCHSLVLDDKTSLSDSGHDRNPWSGHLARITEFLRWSAPVYVLDVAGTDAVHRFDTPVTGCELSRALDASVIETRLLELRDRLADRSVHQFADNGDDAYASELSKRLDTRSAPLARWIAGLSDWQRRPLPVAGAFFAPLSIGGGPSAGSDSAGLPLWRYLADATKHTPGRRTLFSLLSRLRLVSHIYHAFRLKNSKQSEGLSMID